VGSAQALFEEPDHTFVGYFIGNPGMNILPCTVSQHLARIAEVDQPVTVPQGLALGPASGIVKMGIRPEFVECLSAQTDGALAATLLSARDMGTHWLVECRLGAHRVAIKQRTQPAARNGETVWLRFPAERTLYYVNDRRVV
jgi:glycerol transport system ATP-binding protein